MKQVPLFIINGFLDAGKTTFITKTIMNDGFAKETKKRTLLIVTEEGSVDYDATMLAREKVDLLVLPDLTRLTHPDEVKALVMKQNPGRVIVEMNGMADDSAIVWPKCLSLNQYITVIDASTFALYIQNMRQLVMDKVRKSMIVLFNRAANSDVLAPYATSMKLANSNCIYYLEKPDGNVVNAFELPLPYELSTDPIVIADKDFGRWYVDTFDNFERYDGKRLSLSGMAVLDDSLPKGSFVLGRFAMTCCSADIQLYGHLCIPPSGLTVNDRDWVHVTATMTKEWSEEYQEDEPVLHASTVEKIPPLENAILDLTK